MANVLSVNTGTTVLFPPQLMVETIQAVRGKSSLAKLSGTMPVAFKETLNKTRVYKERKVCYDGVL